MQREQYNPRQRVILDCAITLLCERGDAGLTMRQVSDRAGMSLSNVQYYYKTRDDILLALVRRYFVECEAQLVTLSEIHGKKNIRPRVNALLGELLSHGHHLSDMCRIFREIWAISSRNEIIAAEVRHYYERLWVILGNAMLQESATRKRTEKVASLLLPYIEGYSLTGNALPMQSGAVIKMLTTMIEEIATH